MIHLRTAYTLAAVFCFGVLVFLLSIILRTNGLGPIDDHQFISTIFQNKSFGVYIMPGLGRFFPLLGQEYVLISKILRPSPVIFHVIGGMKVFLAGILLFYCLTLTKAKGLTIAVLWSVTMLSIGMANSAIRLQIGEINALILVLIFIWSVLFFENKPSAYSGKPCSVVVIGLVAISAAVFYKETIFVFILSFSVLEIIRNRRKSIRDPIPHYLLILLGIVVCYVFSYLLWRIVSVTGSYTSLQSINIWKIANYYKENDLFFIIIVLPVAIIRLIMCIRESDKQTMYDSLLIASIAYFVTYLALRIYNTYYLLPAYGFATCGLAGLLTKEIGGRLGSAIVLFLSSLLVVNNTPTALSDMLYLRLITNNYYQFVRSLSNWMQLHPLPESKPRNLVLAGVSSGYGVEISMSLRKFLIYSQVPESVFEVKTSEPSDNRSISDFYGLKADEGYTAKENDLVIFNPYQTISIYPPLHAPYCVEIYHSESSWVLPRWTAWDWIQASLTNPSEREHLLMSSMRYAGYSVMLMTRPKLTVPNIHPLADFSYHLSVRNLSNRIHSHTYSKIDVTIENSGTEIWPADGTLRDGNLVHLSYRWFDNKHQMVLEGERTPLPESMKPNDIVEISLDISTPSQPGIYQLEIGPVQEGISWFNTPDKLEVEIY